jgi:hypothetical protein
LPGGRERVLGDAIAAAAAEFAAAYTQYEAIFESCLQKQRVVFINRIWKEREHRTCSPGWDRGSGVPWSSAVRARSARPGSSATPPGGPTAISWS